MTDRHRWRLIAAHQQSDRLRQAKALMKINGPDFEAKRTAYTFVCNTISKAMRLSTRNNRIDTDLLGILKYKTVNHFAAQQQFQCRSQRQRIVTEFHANR